MLTVLIPPSEGKTAPETGPSLDLDHLLFPELNPLRRRLVDSLSRICRENPESAAQSLGLSRKAENELARNAALATAPCAPAGAVYSGVLYSALDWPSLSENEKSECDRFLIVASALFGFLRMTDPIPAYRFSGDTVLPGIGALPPLWRGPLSQQASQWQGLIVDLRSGAYSKLGPLPSDLAERTIVPRVLQKMPSGPPKLVTHFNKATKGRLVRALAGTPRFPETPDAFAQWVAATGPDVSLSPPAKCQCWGLDIVVDHI